MAGWGRAAWGPPLRAGRWQARSAAPAHHAYLPQAPTALTSSPSQVRLSDPRGPQFGKQHWKEASGAGDGGTFQTESRANSKARKMGALEAFLG